MPPAAWIALCGLFFAIAVQGAAFAYMLGRQAERIAVLERENKRDAGVSESVARLDERLKHTTEQLERFDRGLQGVNRQLANLATGKGGVFSSE
ncbi:MAG: hypothetical protein JWP92_3751 [Caulobacter sp.]|nr:hypothetical protein [Caulobacter sp.]